MNIKRRAKLLKIDNKAILEFMTGETILKVGSIPADAELAQAFYDFTRDVWLLLVRHDSFEEIPPGEEFPMFYCQTESAISQEARRVINDDKRSILYKVHDLRLAQILYEKHKDHPDEGMRNHYYVKMKREQQQMDWLLGLELKLTDWHLDSDMEWKGPDGKKL